jgi:hypothetical protein
MRTITACAALVLASASAHADPTLVGRWRSDQALTMAFAKERAKLEDKTVVFLDHIMGKMTLTFTPAKVAVEMPDVETQNAEGVKSQLKGFRESHSYKVIGKTSNQVAVLSTEPVTGRRHITVYTFEDRDTMWVYVGGTTFPHLNIREYFVRVK